MTTQEVCDRLTPESVKLPLKRLNEVVMTVMEAAGCSWIDALRFIRDTAAKAIEKIAGEE